MHETDYLDVNRLKQTFNRVVNENIEGQLDKLTKSTTIVWGQKDSITPLSIAKILHSRIKNSQLIIMKNATHFPFLDFPEQFCDEIRKITRSL